MKIGVVVASAMLVIVSAPLAARAQGVPGGIAHGIHEGNRRAGPIGAVVGGAVGGVIGGVEGVLGVNQHYGEYQDYSEAPPPPRLHRHRKVVRHWRHVRSRRSSLHQ